MTDGITRLRVGSSTKSYDDVRSLFEEGGSQSRLLSREKNEINSTPSSTDLTTELYNCTGTLIMRVA